MSRVAVIGQDVWSALNAEREQSVPRSESRPECFSSNPLCDWQKSVSRRGFVGAELVKSLYGWSLRYESGLNNFALIAGSRCGELDGTYEDAVRYAKTWQGVDPARRYVTVFAQDIPNNA